MLSTVPYMQLSVRVPIYDPSMIHPDYGSAKPPSAVPSTKLVDDHPSIATWEMWDSIRSICEYHPRLNLSQSIPVAEKPVRKLIPRNST